MGEDTYFKSDTDYNELFWCDTRFYEGVKKSEAY